MQEETIKKYFQAWEQQDVTAISRIFTPDAKYKARAFGVDDHVGIKAIEEYWTDNPIKKQINPRLKVITQMMKDNLAFIEWECVYDTELVKNKKMRGMMLLEFRGDLINELREHYEVEKV